MVWFLEEPALLDALSDLSFENVARREHIRRDYAGGRLFLKFFAERNLEAYIRRLFKPRVRREYHQSLLMRSLSIPTPRIFGYAKAPEGSCVVQEWIDGEPFLGALEQEGERPKLLAALADLLKLLKAKGVRHNDLHLENILVSDGRLVLIDLQKARVKVSLSAADHLQNVAQALAMIYDGMTEDEKRRFFAQLDGQELRAETEVRLEVLRKRWVDRKAARVFRNTSKLFAEGDRVFVRGREERATGEHVSVLKKDRRVLVERFSDHVRKVYAGRARLKRAWQNHVVLEYLGVAVTPQPFFVSRAALFRKGFIAMEDLGPKGEELDRFLDRRYDGMSRAERTQLVQRLCRFFVSLFKQSIMHRDLKACNLFAVNDEGFRLLDVEDFVFERPNFDTLVTLLVQLNTTVPKRIHISDRVHFLKCVVEGIGFDARKVLKAVARASRGKQIVYEGLAGLKEEAWA
jgi:tRNA A-37 threonylcarbamoyl transferase component Bud32